MRIKCGSMKVMENYFDCKKINSLGRFSCEIKCNQKDIKIIFLENFYENGKI